MKNSATGPSRLIIADDNIRGIGGHFFELAGLLLDGAAQLGYQGVLATHASFDRTEAINPAWQVIPTFRPRRLVHWSLGVDGHSKYQRDFEGNTVGGSATQNAVSNWVDRFRPKRCPQKMLRRWAEDLAGLVNRLKPTATDALLINTADDFALLALAAAMRRCNLAPLRIDVVFHFALYHPTQSDRKERLVQIGRQIRAAIGQLKPHDLHLHATTENLADQYRQTDCGSGIGAIPYPTRPRDIAPGSTGQPLKAVLAGLPRAEKGKAAISELLAAIQGTLLKNRRFQLSMQMPAQRWQGMIPESLHASYQRATAGSTSESFEIMTDDLSTGEYHRWLDSADLGLFLYEPNRYIARCSGVLLEMLARGVPVIVPDKCWLADQVRLAGGHRSIGFIYQNRSEIPDLMSQFIRHREKIRACSMQYAQRIAKRHDGRNTLTQMGLPDLRESSMVA